MKLISTFTFAFTLVFSDHIAQSQDLTGWGADTLEIANTAKNATYLSAAEKKLIQVINLARLNGNAFIDRVAIPYVKKNEIDQDEFVLSLYADLKNATDLHVLTPLEKLWESATHHANDMGHKGLIGHESSDGTTHLARIKRYHSSETLGESLCYGYDDPVDIVMQLLLDEAIALRTNRQNILGNKFHNLGVSIRPHSIYEFNCVIDFSGN